MTSPPTPPHGENRIMSVTIYGASDDLIEIAGCKGADEFNASMKDNDNPLMAEFVLSGEGGQIRIVALYDGCWSFAIAPVDEEVPIPAWPIKMSLHERGYSTLVEIDVPGVPVIVRKAI